MNYIGKNKSGLASTLAGLLLLSAPSVGLPQTGSSSAGSSSAGSSSAGSSSAGSSSEGSSSAASREALVKERYGALEWTQGPLVPGIALGELNLLPYGADAMEYDAGVLTRTYRSPGAEAPAFQVEAEVFDSAAEAHDELVRWLAGVSSQALAPRVATLGDAAYAAPTPTPSGPKSWVLFVRGNVAVSVSVLDSSRTPNLDLVPLARAVDASIVALRPEAPLERVLRPEVRQLLVPATAKGPRPVSLGVDAVGPYGQPCHLRWTVSGAGQGYVQKDRAGAWKFHPTGPGETTLTLEATSRYGVLTRATAQVAVSR